MIMEENVQKATFRFLDYIIQESSMRINGKTMGSEINLKIDLNAATPPHVEIPELTLAATVKDDRGDFELFLKIIGYFKSDNADEESLNKFMAFNAPAILFPYVRSYVSSLTAQAGITPVLLPTVNLHSVGVGLLKGLNKG